MSAEDRALLAIKVTRSTLARALLDLEVLVQMTAWDVEPDAVEYTVAKVLEYLDKTREEAKEVET